MIAELGLRYRPSNQADLEEHAGLLALLGRDLANMPPNHLGGAIERWIKQSPFMPKASDLIQMAKSIQAGEAVSSGKFDDAYWRRKCDDQNVLRMNNQEVPHDIRHKAHWVPINGGGMRLAWDSEFVPSHWDGPLW